MQVKSVDYYIKKLQNQIAVPRGILKKTVRELLKNRKKIDEDPITVKNTLQYIQQNYSTKMKPLINATGIILHTNIGRAPLTDEQLSGIHGRYCSLEFDLKTGTRGDRNSIASELILKLFEPMFENIDNYDALIVNNNASALYLILNSLSDYLVTVANSELIEIGGSFRLPDVIKNTGAQLRTVGCTNSTRIVDYDGYSGNEIFLKSSTSNYTVEGFVKLLDLQTFIDFTVPTEGTKLKYYDAGTVLIEPDEIKDGSWDKAKQFRGLDILSFSGDKSFGGPQCGVIIGKKELIKKFKKNPIMRMLRPDKLTLSILEKTTQFYLFEQFNKIGFHQLYGASSEILKKKAEKLKEIVSVELTRIFPQKRFSCSIEETEVYLGAGSSPNKKIKSIGVIITCDNNRSARNLKKFFLDHSIVVIFKKNSNNKIILDVKSLTDQDIEQISVILKGATDAEKKY